jgi:hypothetical protein
MLNAYVFESIAEVRALTANWLVIYDAKRPHDSHRRVRQWQPSLLSRRISSADEYLALVRRFAPAGVPLRRGTVTRSRIRVFVDGLTLTPRSTSIEARTKPPAAVSGATRNPYRDALSVWAQVAGNYDPL